VKGQPSLVMQYSGVFRMAKTGYLSTHVTDFSAICNITVTFPRYSLAVRVR